MIKHTFLALFLGLAAFIIYLMIHLGIWKSPEISTQHLSNRKILAKNHLGAYHKITPVIQQVEAFAKKFNIPCSQTFGEYFDDPTQISEDRLRSRAGCVVPVETDFINSKFTAADLSVEHIELVELPASQAVTAQFTGSPAIGPYKVYPKIDRYLLQNKLKQTGAVMEVYDIKGAQEMTTTYIVLVQ